ncbi:hypothetical protein BDZ89DRAFT_952605 [Hymenopellis radicata]|nr:hypothetical protein BDZ89DRAFT_952605 [Hymenopellis radicata]
MAQGMPNSVLTALNDKIVAFWFDCDPSCRGRVSISTLHAPRSAGGMNLLNLAHRNDAVSLVRLRSYLRMADRAPWAIIADELLKLSMTADDRRRLNSFHIDNMFLQGWNVALKGPNAHLPPAVRHMISVARKYGISFDGLWPSSDVRGSLPLWFHFALDCRSGVNTERARCMRLTHGI